MVNINADLNYDNHLEIQLVKNKAPEPKSNNGLLITLAVILSFVITLALSFSPISEPEDPIEVTRFGRSFAQSPNNVNQVNPEERTSTLDVSPFILEKGFRVRINSCNGADHQGANFRDYPALTPLTIRGIVREGEWVTLTGETFWADGIQWYGVINDFALERSEEANAQNQTSANQTGWIADCFIE